MKKLLVILSSLLLLGGKCFAEPVASTQCLSDGETVSFKLTGFGSSAAISVHITDESGNVEFEDEMYSDESGCLEFSYSCKGESGNYKAVFAEPEGTNTAQSEYIFVSRTLTEQMKTDFENANSYFDFYNNYFEFLSVDKAVYDTLSDKETALSYARANLTGETSVENIEKAFYAAVFCAKVNETKSADTLLELLTDEAFDSALGFTADMPEKDGKGVLYTASEIVKSSVLSDAVSSELKTAEEFKKDLYLDIFLTSIEKADYYTTVRNILETYDKAAFVDIDVAKYDKKSDSTLPFKSMMGKSYSGYNDAKDAFDGYTYSSSSSGNGGGGGGTSSSGGKTSSGTRIPSGVSASSTANSNTQVKENAYADDIAEAPWAEEAIKALWDKGIMTGDDEGKFRPMNNITRAETAAVICRITEISGAIEISFNDVSADDWFYPYVCAAYGAGLFGGKSETEFDPNAYITREEMAVVINRIKKLSPGTGFTFADDGNISDWARESVYSLYSAGIINGKTETEFAPGQNITRAETAAMLYRMGDVK